MSAALSTPGSAMLRLGGRDSNRRGRPLLAEDFDACIRPAFHRRCSSVKGTRVRRTARAAGMSGTIVTGSGLSPRRRDSDRACAGQYRALCGKRGNFTAQKHRVEATMSDKSNTVRMRRWRRRKLVRSRVTSRGDHGSRDRRARPDRLQAREAGRRGRDRRRAHRLHLRFTIGIRDVVTVQPLHT